MPNNRAIAEATYERHLPNLRQWAGWFALVRGDQLGGVFPTYAAATAAWMAMYGPVPALIRRIEASTPGVAPEAAESVPSAGAVVGTVHKTLRRRPEATDGDHRFVVVCGWAFPFGRPAHAPESVD
jgi:hypothetical protein